MSTDLRLASQNNVANIGGAIVNRWAQVVEVAQPTINALVKMRDLRQWLEDQPWPVSFDLDEKWVPLIDDSVKARLAALPEKHWLEQAAQLFDDAVHKSAPEPLYYLALGTMLSSIPSAKNVPADYQFAVVDMILHDHDTWEKGCEPGFSVPVFVSAIREARRSDERDFVPGAAKILSCCQTQRKRFREALSDVKVLSDLRDNAEQALAELERQAACRKPKPPGWKPPVYPEDGSDCPF